MLKIGCHISIAKGYAQAGRDAVKIGANTFQYFTRNPRGGASRELDFEDAQKLWEICKEHDFAPLFAHAPYTMNLCSDKASVREFARNVMREDLQRLKELPPSYYIFHPGSHKDQGVEAGIAMITEALNEILTEELDVMVLLEGMSGKGTEIGSTFEELQSIIEGVRLQQKIGVCLDTCHLYSAGYDIVNDLDGVLKRFDDIVGLERLKAIHLNDSKVPFASKKDRHEVLGKGTIGLEPVLKIITHPDLKDLVFNLETPNELEGYGEEINLLKEKTKDQ